MRWVIRVSRINQVQWGRVGLTKWTIEWLMTTKVCCHYYHHCCYCYCYRRCFIWHSHFHYSCRSLSLSYLFMKALSIPWDSCVHTIVFRQAVSKCHHYVYGKYHWQCPYQLKCQWSISSWEIIPKVFESTLYHVNHAHYLRSPNIKNWVVSLILGNVREAKLPLLSRCVWYISPAWLTLALSITAART